MKRPPLLVFFDGTAGKALTDLLFGRVVTGFVCDVAADFASGMNETWGVFSLTSNPPPEVLCDHRTGEHRSRHQRTDPTSSGELPKCRRMSLRACSTKERPAGSPSCTSHWHKLAMNVEYLYNAWLRRKTSHRHRWAMNFSSTSADSVSKAPSTAARATTSGRRAHQTWRVEMWPWRMVFSRRAEAESSRRGSGVSIRKR
jgi:hypothetical protein